MPEMSPSLLRRWIVRAVVLAGAVVVFSPGEALASSTYYVAPTGSSAQPCTQAVPCSFSYWFASVEPGLGSGDVTILEGNDGTYGSAGTPITSRIDVPGGATLEGDPTQARPVIYSDANFAGIDVVDGALTDVELHYSGTYQGLLETGGVITRVIVDATATNGRTCGLGDGTTITDSVFAGVEGAYGSGGGATLDVTLRNDTIYGSTGALIINSSATAVQFTISNTIIHSASGPDITAEQPSSGSVAVTLDHSDYATTDATGSATITAPGTGTNLTAAPSFVNLAADDFHEASGSPTIDAGTDNAANGPIDLDANPRQIGAHTDIGAFEFLIAPTVNTTAATAVTETSATLNGSTNPNGLVTTYDFQYGATASYGSATTATSAGAATTASSETAAITGLSPGTTYHYRLIATNAAGTTYGADETLTTAQATVATVQATLTGLTLSPIKFAPAKRGPTATLAKAHKPKTPIGTTITYTLNEAASVTFTVTESVPGRETHAGSCVKPTHSNRHAKACTRRITKGSFTEPGSTGPNSLKFSGRLGGHKLAKGHYTLTAVPTANALAGLPQTAAFQIT
jgi:hypothetical protein